MELPKEITGKEKIKIAIKSTDVVSDGYVEKILSDYKIKSVEDLDEINGCLQKHRPLLYQRLNRTVRSF